MAAVAFRRTFTGNLADLVRAARKEIRRAYNQFISLTGRGDSNEAKTTPRRRRRLNASDHRQFGRVIFPASICSSPQASLVHRVAGLDRYLLGPRSKAVLASRPDSRPVGNRQTLRAVSQSPADFDSRQGPLGSLGYGVDQRFGSGTPGTGTRHSWNCSGDSEVAPPLPVYALPQCADHSASGCTGHPCRIVGVPKDAGNGGAWGHVRGAGSTASVEKSALKQSEQLPLIAGLLRRLLGRFSRVRGRLAGWLF